MFFWKHDLRDEPLDSVCIWKKTLEILFTYLPSIFWLPKAVNTRMGKEVERTYPKKCPNMVCAIYSLWQPKSSSWLLRGGTNRRKGEGENLVLFSNQCFRQVEFKSFLELKSYNHFHNILRLFDVLTNFPFTASETMCNYYL